MTSQFEQGHSPAVRAVLNAYRDASWAPDTKDPNKHHKWSHKAGLAAALRVVADEVLPSPRLPFDSCCEIRSAGERVELLAIATELEGTHDFPINAPANAAMAPMDCIASNTLNNTWRTHNE